MRPALPRLVFLALTITLALSAFAQTDNWKGGTGNWSNSLDWDAGVPGPSSDVTIFSGHTDMVTLDVDSTINSLTLGGATGQSYLFSTSPQKLTVSQDLNLGLFGSLGLFDHSTLSVGGNVMNGGQINLGVWYLPSQVKANIAGVLTNTQSGLSGVTVDRDSSLTVSGIVSYGGIAVQNGGTLTVNGDLQNLRVPGQYTGNIETACDHCPSVGGNKIQATGSIVNDGIFDLNLPGDIATAPRVENSTEIYLAPGSTLQVGSGPFGGSGYYESANGIYADHIANGVYASAIIRLEGPIHLGGTLQILQQEGWNPPPGQQVPLIEFDGNYTVTGDFDKIENQYFNNGTEMWEVVKFAGGTFLQAVAVQDAQPQSQR